MTHYSVTCVSVAVKYRWHWMVRGEPQNKFSLTMMVGSWFIMTSCPHLKMTTVRQQARFCVQQFICTHVCYIHYQLGLRSKTGNHCTKTINHLTSNASNASRLLIWNYRTDQRGVMETTGCLSPTSLLQINFQTSPSSTVSACSLSHYYLPHNYFILDNCLHLICLRKHEQLSQVFYSSLISVHNVPVFCRLCESFGRVSVTGWECV